MKSSKLGAKILAAVLAGLMIFGALAATIAYFLA